MIKILIYEPDNYWKSLLETLPYNLSFAKTEDEVYKLTFEENFDFYIFDFQDGYSILDELRDSGDNTICFFISFLEDFHSQRTAYKIADEFFKKSFVYIEEIKIKLEYHIKKHFGFNEGTIRYKDIFYNIKTHTLYKKEKKIELTTLENELLILFLKNKNRYIPKEQILHQLKTTEGSLKVKIHHLRKLGFDIQNSREIGYKLKEQK